MEINPAAHLGRELEESPSGVREESTCFPVHAAGGLLPVATAASRNRAEQSPGVICVCSQGGGAGGGRGSSTEHMLSQEVLRLYHPSP